MTDWYKVRRMVDRILAVSPKMTTTVKDLARQARLHRMKQEEG